MVVIVILAVILVIAVPQITDVIGSAKKGIFVSSASTILSAAEERYEENKVLGLEKEITCESVVSMSSGDYKTCQIEFINEESYITLIGMGKFEGMSICSKNKDNIIVVDGCIKTLTFDSNGGEVSPTTKNIAVGEAYGELPVPTKEGYAFVGWYTLADSGVKVSEYTKASDAKDMTLYAHWNPKTRLTINLDGGSVLENKNGLYFANDLVDLENPTKDGFIFAGWRKISGNSVINVNNTITIGSEDTEIIALWSSVTYTINYNCNGGEGLTASSTHKYGEEKPLTINGCYKITEGTSGMVYYLKGWATTENATTPTYLNGVNVKDLTNENNATINLYAVWDSLFSYGGNYEVKNDTDGNWRVRLLGDSITHYGTHNLTFNKNIYIDAFLVGAGGGSEAIYAGGGGYTTTEKNIEIFSNKEYPISIGAGSVGNNGGDTTAFNLIGAGGKSGSNGSAGGSGGGRYNWQNNSYGGSYGADGAGGPGGVGQKTTTCEFEQSASGSVTDLTGCAFNVLAYGGAGGGARISGSILYISSPGGNGGGGASGYGGNAEYGLMGTPGVNGTPNTGGGGGSRETAGGSGIVIIRNAR